MMSQIVITVGGQVFSFVGLFSIKQLSSQHCHVTKSQCFSVVVTSYVIAIVHFYRNVSLQIRNKTLMREE